MNIGVHVSLSDLVSLVCMPSIGIANAQGCCTGMTQRDGIGREVGGGSGWGTHVNPWLIHVNVWQKPLQYCKVISLQLIKIIGGKKETVSTLWYHAISNYGHFRYKNYSHCNYLCLIGIITLFYRKTIFLFNR